MRRPRRFLWAAPTRWGPAFQGRGCGTVMAQVAMNEATAPITLDVVEWNQQAVSLYTKLGFGIIQTTSSHRRMNV
ncbi:MAG: GNAT family N-acetyltransferase [Eubacteriales bacterium]|nr:GNAT family N-acetyltransferase [Eubacteriales bacterium]